VGFENGEGCESGVKKAERCSVRIRSYNNP
jgi:hypothetical protein